MNQPQYINEVLFQNNDIIQINNQYHIAKRTVKIELDNSKASGFFLKFERNNRPFYCLMTNQHVIQSRFVEEKKKIRIIYDNEDKYLDLILDREERIIICFKEMLDADVTLVEIIPKDKIDNSYFLIPNMNYFHLDNKPQKIQLVQFPSGKVLSQSSGEIVSINCDNINYFFHNASTKFGSSGSPIVLGNDKNVFAIHKGSTLDKRFNVGIFIRNLVEIMELYKKNGIFKDYYENGQLKYEGNFKDDEYNDEYGKFYFENGDVYTGQFKNGKKHGIGFIVKKNGVIKENAIYENDECINKEEEEKDNHSSGNKTNIESENKNENENNFTNFFQNLNWGDVFTQASHVLQPLGNILGYRCDKPSCQHESKSHKAIGYGKYECQECPKDSNICEIQFNKK
jgi:hypothetical protein